MLSPHLTPLRFRVEVGVVAEKPRCRIVHLQDWHFVPKDLYAIDMKNVSGRELSEEQIDQLHHKLLLEVEAVQLEQMALLRYLIKHHGLKRIFCEGLTAKDLPDYQEKIAVLREMEEKQISELRKQLADVRELLKGMDPYHFIIKDLKDIISLGPLPEDFNVSVLQRSQWEWFFFVRHFYDTLENR